MTSIATSTFNTRIIFTDYVRFSGTLALPNESVVSDNIATAGIDHDKIQHVKSISGFIASPAAGTTLLQIQRNHGTVLAVKAALCTTIPSGDKTLGVNVHTTTRGSIMTTVTLDTSSVLNDIESATLLSNVNVPADDIISLVLTTGGSTGTDPAGLLYTIYISEDGV